MNNFQALQKLVFYLVSLTLLTGAYAQAGGHPSHEKLVWQENFRKASGPRPDPKIWTYEAGATGWGNGELEDYCAYGSQKKPCDPARPNAYVARDGYLHIVARKTPDGSFTSARLLSKGLKSFRYGRFEARIRVPSGQGMWPAFWLLGDDIDTQPWPRCGELDVMEHIGKEPGSIHGSVHGQGFPGPAIGTTVTMPDGKPVSAGFHNFGMIWKPGSVAYYVDDEKKPYAVVTKSDLPQGAVWPFDDRNFFLLLNLAVGGGWPGNPDATTVFPSEMLVDYIKIWGLP